MNKEINGEPILKLFQESKIWNYFFKHDAESISHEKMTMLSVFQKKIFKKVKEE